MTLRSSFFEFLEIYDKETARKGLYFVTPQVSGAETFLGDFFLKFSEQIISRATVTDRF